MVDSLEQCFGIIQITQEGDSVWYRATHGDPNQLIVSSSGATEVCGRQQKLLS